jgi:hypothetical protein
VDRVTPARLADIDEMNQQMRTLDVTQKLNPETVALMSAFNQSWNVGDNEGLIISEGDHSQIRLKCCKRIIGNLRFSGRDPRDQRRLSSVRESDQTDIRQQLQLKAQVALITGATVFVFSGCLVRRRREASVPPSASASLGGSELLPRLREVEKLVARVRIVNHRTHGHWNLNGFPFLSRTIAALSMTAALSRVLRIEPEVEQGVVVRIGNHHDVAAASPVATARAAMGNVLLTPKRETAVAAVAGFHLDPYFVYKH